MIRSLCGHQFGVDDRISVDAGVGVDSDDVVVFFGHHGHGGTPLFRLMAVIVASAWKGILSGRFLMRQASWKRPAFYQVMTRGPADASASQRTNR